MFKKIVARPPQTRHSIYKTALLKYAHTCQSPTKSTIRLWKVWCLKKIKTVGRSLVIFTRLVLCKATDEIFTSSKVESSANLVTLHSFNREIASFLTSLPGHHTFLALVKSVF